MLGCTPTYLTVSTYLIHCLCYHWKNWNLCEQNWPFWERYNGGERPLKLVVVKDVFPSCGLCNNIIWAAVTWPCTISTPLCHTYSEPSGHEDSPGGTQNIPYLFKNLSKSRLSDPFFGLFWVISEVGSQIYIANLAFFKIWVFSATFWHEITLYISLKYISNIVSIYQFWQIYLTT